MSRRATLGQFMVNKLLPEDLQDYQRVWDKGGMTTLLRSLAEKHPDKYREVLHNLTQVAREAATATGGHSFGLQHLRMANVAKQSRLKLKQQMRQILDDDNLDDDTREERILAATRKMKEGEDEAIYQESLKEENPLAYQVLSGSRGNKGNLASLRGSDALYVDHRERTIPVPVLHSYSQGLSPLEYWAGSYGARKGVLATKMATADAGYFSKQLSQAAHRLLVSELDSDKEPAGVLGLPVSVDDDDSEGALLAAPVGGYQRNTVLTPKILRELRDKGMKRILVRSPAVGGPPDGGLYARDAGVREKGGLPPRGEMVGLIAASALGEPLSQGMLSAKHSGGVAGANKSVGGFQYINSLVQTPKVFPGGATHAETDGTIERIAEAPAGGYHVYVHNQEHYVPADLPLKVKKGQWVEAGDVLSEGIPNPGTIVQHKGIGEGRRYFIDSFRDAYKSAGVKASRRNIEVLSKGLINHVRLNSEFGDYVPDDVIPYSLIERDYQPRTGAAVRPIPQAIGKYLERPYLHYTIGTKVRPSMLKDFQEFGVKDVEVHDDPPPFDPEMQRGMTNLQHDPDWMTQMYGSGLKGSLLESAQRGATSDAAGTSFVPGLAKAVDFGTTGKVQTPRSQTWQEPPQT